MGRVFDPAGTFLTCLHSLSLVRRLTGTRGVALSMGRRADMLRRTERRMYRRRSLSERRCCRHSVEGYPIYATLEDGAVNQHHANILCIFAALTSIRTGAEHHAKRGTARNNIIW